MFSHSSNAIAIEHTRHWNVVCLFIILCLNYWNFRYFCLCFQHASLSFWYPDHAILFRFGWNFVYVVVLSVSALLECLFVCCWCCCCCIVPNASTLGLIFVIFRFMLLCLITVCNGHLTKNKKTVVLYHQKRGLLLFVPICFRSLLSFRVRWHTVFEQQRRLYIFLIIFCNFSLPVMLPLF